MTRLAGLRLIAIILVLLGVGSDGLTTPQGQSLQGLDRAVRPLKAACHGQARWGLASGLATTERSHREAPPRGRARC